MVTFDRASDSSRSVAFFFSGCIAVTFYNAAEIIILIFATFKEYGGCYFWSLLVSSLGLIVTTMGFTLYFFEITPLKFVQSAVTIAGWWAFIIGQSLVLWSRLHFVLSNQMILRGVLAMIIVDSIVLLIPTTVISLANDVDPVPAPFLAGYPVMESIQVTMFCIQEIIISGLYIWATIKLLDFTAESRKRRLIAELLILNITLVSMDFVLLGVQYSGYRLLQVALKGFVYSMKIKFEFAVLNRLTTFMRDAAQLSLNEVSDIRDSERQGQAATK